jgi:hypothetical protein
MKEIQEVQDLTAREILLMLEDIKTGSINLNQGFIDSIEILILERVS